jgi:hypothetical protein
MKSGSTASEPQAGTHFQAFSILYSQEKPPREGQGKQDRKEIKVSQNPILEKSHPLPILQRSSGMSIIS